MSPEQYIRELALQVSDPDFEDFAKPVYHQALFRTGQEIAAEFRLETFVYSFRSRDDKEIELNLPAFMAEQRVFVNGTPLMKASVIDDTKDDALYYLQTVNGKRVFSYNGKVKDDDVVIIYTVQPEGFDYQYDDPGILPMVPTAGERDHLRRGALYLAQIGIAKFSKEKRAKYQTIYQMNMKQSYDPKITPTSEWISIKPFTLL